MDHVCLHVCHYFHCRHYDLLLLSGHYSHGPCEYCKLDWHLTNRFHYDSSNAPDSHKSCRNGHSSNLVYSLHMFSKFNHQNKKNMHAISFLCNLCFLWVVQNLFEQKSDTLSLWIHNNVYLSLNDCRHIHIS